ncbi:MAG: fibronectin type III domain-containing protein [Pseudomonadales bacterium]|nr:fibronectin type III domain-containing protein [Pseudomonadales bacterium]
MKMVIGVGVLASMLLAACGGGGSSGMPQHKHVAGASGKGEGVATLRWQAPGQRMSGESLKMADIESYRLRYGQESDLSETSSTDVMIQDGQGMAFRVTGLPPGTWYFSIRAVDRRGRAGPWSEIVGKEIVAN